MYVCVASSIMCAHGLAGAFPQCVKALLSVTSNICVLMCLGMP